MLVLGLLLSVSARVRVYTCAVNMLLQVRLHKPLKAYRPLGLLFSRSYKPSWPEDSNCLAGRSTGRFPSEDVPVDAPSGSESPGEFSSL